MSSPPATAGVAGDVPTTHELRRLGSGGVLNLSSALIAQLFTFATVALLGNAFGASAVGIYSEAFAVRALVALLCLGGMRNAMTRYVAAFRAESDPGAVRGTIRIGVISAIALSSVATVALVLLTPWLANEAFQEPELEQGLMYAAWSLIPATVTIVALAATQGFQTMRAYAIIGSVLDTGIRMVFVLIGVTVGGGLEFGLLGLFVSSVVTMIAALIALRRLSRRVAHVPARYEYREIFSFSLYSWLASVANQGLLWADTVILGLYLPSRDVGIYQVSTRAVLLATLAVVPLTVSYAPLAADLWQRRAVPRLARLYRATAEWLLRISFPPLLIAAVFAGAVLKVFGTGFAGGVVVTQIFAFGALIDVWASASGVTLNMSGFNKLNMFDTVAVLMVNIALNIILIPQMGIVGSVWAWTIALGMYGAVRVVQVKKLILGVWPLSNRTKQSLVAAVPATIVALSARALLGDTFVGLFVGGAASLGVYVLVLSLYGLGHEDRLLFARGSGRTPEPSTSTSTAPARKSTAGPWGSYDDRRRAVNATITSAAYKYLPKYRRPDEPVPLRTLISPLRADILVRAGFFDFVEEQAASGPLDPAALVEGARALPYYEWFRSVATVHIGIAPEYAASIEDAFATRVRRSVDLWDRYNTHGFDVRRPILLTWYDAVRTESGKELSGRYQPLDGCHRIALLWRSGVVALDPSHCWVRESNRPAIDNTLSLLRTGAHSERDYARYLALGFLPDDDVQDLAELTERVRATGDDVQVRQLKQIVTIDRATMLDRV